MQCAHRIVLRAPVLAAIVVAVMIARPGRACAGAWYYTWHCSGQCAPNQLAIHGYEGPFATADACTSVRANDPRADQFVAAGNLGGLDFCRESDGPPTSGGDGGTRILPLARLVALVDAGPGYRIQDPGGALEPSRGSTEGVELAAHFGAHPLFGAEILVGFHYTRITAPHFGAGVHSMMLVPILMGFTSQPALLRGRRVELRLDLGADAGILQVADCSGAAFSSCGGADMLPSSSFLTELRVGLDAYFGAGKRHGVGLDALFMFGNLGDTADPVVPSAIAVVPPTVLVRASLIWRIDNIAW